MIKKLYSLFSILLLLASCATEEIEQIEIQPTDGSMVSLSFSVDAPNALEITKATGDVEKGVESLYLYTFNEDGEFISPVVEAVVSGNGYTASISKETRTIHFVANDGTLTPSLESGMASLGTDKQIFWGKRTFSEIPAKNSILLNIIIKIRKRLLLLLRRNLMVARPIHIIRLILP